MLAEIFVYLFANESQVLRTTCSIKGAQISVEWMNSEPKASREERNIR